MPTPHEKGTALEAVVEAIESLILQTSPTAKEKTHLIETRKIVESDGVRHEIDLHVTSDIAPGYRAVFIFECKNWKEKVDKNEIIIFSEKIRTCKAQTGFFIAKSFTSDARAQAKKDLRMVLKTVTEHDPANTILPFGFQYTFQNPTGIKAKFRRRGSAGSDHFKLEVVGSTLVVDGTATELSRYIDEWVVIAINESMRTFPSGTLGDGVYQESCRSNRNFESGRFVVNRMDIESINLEVTFEVHVKRPAVISHFEVEGRGRVITIEGYTYGAATIDKVEFIFGPETS